MLKASTNSGTFFEKLNELAKESFDDLKRIKIAKKRYLDNKKDDILQAAKDGYTYPMIAQATTAELLETDVPKSFTRTTKEGKEIVVETKITFAEIKEICEPGEAE